jgi:hypothetical protein
MDHDDRELPDRRIILRLIREEAAAEWHIDAAGP